MSANGTIVVHAAGATRCDAALSRVAEPDPESLIAAVGRSEDPGALVVAVDEACADDDVLVAVVSVLVVDGVQHIETSRPQVVRRVFDMHRAIRAGAIEVLES